MRKNDLPNINELNFFYSNLAVIIWQIYKFVGVSAIVFCYAWWEAISFQTVRNLAITTEMQ